MSTESMFNEFVILITDLVEARILATESLNGMVSDVIDLKLAERDALTVDDIEDFEEGVINVIDSRVTIETSINTY
jgi:hypothetical protein